MSKSSCRGVTCVGGPVMYGTPTSQIRAGGTVWKRTSAGPGGLAGQSRNARVVAVDAGQRRLRPLDLEVIELQVQLPGG